MPTYYLKTHELHNPKMYTTSFSLQTSKRSGHPIFPISGSVTAKYDLATHETAGNSPPGIDVSPQGTWKPITNGHASAKFEVLDLTDRFGYQPPMKAKTRPKNAPKKGFKPSRMSTLPMKRPIYEISSGEDDEDDEDGDDETFSELSPLYKKRSRMTPFNKHTYYQDSVLEEIQAAAGENGLSALNQAQIQITSAEATLPGPSTYPLPVKDNLRPSPHPSVSSETVRAINDGYVIGDIAAKLPADDNVPTDNNTFTTGQSNAAKQATILTTRPSISDKTTDTVDVLATTVPNGSTLSTTIPILQTTLCQNLPPYILNHTTLRVYLPNGGVILPYERIYVPLKLRSCVTIQDVFSAAAKVLYAADRPLFYLDMRLDGAIAGAKGAIAVRADIEDTWECFLEEVQRWEGWHEDGQGDLGVEVRGYTAPEGQGV
ncbi:MAG: hypothetical protein L6R41_004823 [Letrouitia leprolyta]|nr:MAG: hypothetical protein L6R41_004823 [Letrouitia leprolyta]